MKKVYIRSIARSVWHEEIQQLYSMLDNGMIKEYHKEKIVDDTVLRFAYDYKTRNMFVEKKDENGNIVWQYLDPSKADDYEYYHNGLQQMLSAGECAFYLAYNMSFYDQPVSYAFRKYLNEL